MADDRKAQAGDLHGRRRRRNRRTRWTGFRWGRRPPRSPTSSPCPGRAGGRAGVGTVQSASSFPVSAGPTRAALATDLVTCPECGQMATVDMARRQAEDFCRNCDYPLFWANSTVIAPSGEDTGASLRRLPGTVGRAATAALLCPHCGEPNSPAAQICIRCALSLHPVEIPEPEPVVVIPEPEPEPEPPPGTGVRVVVAGADRDLHRHPGDHDHLGGDELTCRHRQPGMLDTPKRLQHSVFHRRDAEIGEHDGVMVDALDQPDVQRRQLLLPMLDPIRCIDSGRIVEEAQAAPARRWSVPAAARPRPAWDRSRTDRGCPRSSPPIDVAGCSSGGMPTRS